MNWGKGIIIGLSIFIIFITSLVIKMMSVSTDLESEDYYAREVNYEQEITALKNARLLNALIDITENQEHLVFQLPEDIAIADLEIKMIRPNSQKLDKVYKVAGTKTFLVSKDELEKGNYRIELRFKAREENCMQKQNIIL